MSHVAAAKSLSMSIPPEQLTAGIVALVGAGGLGGLGGAWLQHRATMSKQRIDADHQAAVDEREEEKQESELAIQLTRAAQEWLKEQEAKIREVGATCASLQSQLIAAQQQANEAQQQANEALKTAARFQMENILLAKQLIERDQVILALQERHNEMERLIDEQKIMLDTSEKARASLEAARRQAEKARAEAEYQLIELAERKHEPLPMTQTEDQKTK